MDRVPPVERNVMNRIFGVIKEKRVYILESETKSLKMEFNNIVTPSMSGTKLL